MADFYPIDPEDQLIGAFRIGNLAVVFHPRLSWKLQLVEVAEILGPISLAVFRYRNARIRLTHQVERVGKELRSAEVARFQGKQHVTLFCADGPQYRHSGCDFRADEKTRNA